MCGITGFLAPNGIKDAGDVIQKMTAALSHRGPDGQGVLTESNIALGHRRLSILDISTAGHQPMADASGQVIVSYNGEIYNFKKLRSEIKKECGYQFVTGCDTEILPIGFKIWGEGLIDRLEGMFAIAIWDRKSQQLTLARDGIGIKPLYIYEHIDNLYFASEIKSFLAIPGHDFKLSPLDFHQYLANGYVGPERSTLVGVSQLSPGTIRTYDRNATILSETKYWAPSRKGKIDSLSHASELIEDNLRSVVSDMMISDVPIGIMQSAGVDSSLISFSAKGYDVPLFTAGFSSRSFDETEGARLVAQETGHKHHIVSIENADQPDKVLKALALATDAQLSDSSGFAMYRLCKTIKQHVTVALSGEGGDEFFAGYPTYRASSIASPLRHVFPASLAKLLGKISMAHNNSRDGRIPIAEKIGRFMMGLSAAGESPHPQWRRYLFKDQISDLYGSRLKEFEYIDPMTNYIQNINEIENNKGLDAWMLGDQKYYLPSDMLVKSDRISMAHSLEIRVPFLDRRIMELAGNLHHSVLTSLRGPDKLALRKTLARLTREEQLVSGHKRGFNVPISRILVDELLPTCNKIFRDEPDRFAPWLNADGIRKLWCDHSEGRRSHHYLLWSLLVFGIWTEKHSISE